MKKLIAFVVVFVPLVVSATDIRPLVDNILEHNATLMKYATECEAAKADNHYGLTLADPEVEFNYLWGAPNDVGQRKDISVSQSFDYATVFGLKRKTARSKDDLALLQYRMARQLLHQEVILLLADIASLNEKYDDYAHRLDDVSQLVMLYGKKLKEGDINKIEYNKLRLSETMMRSQMDEILLEKAALTNNPAFLGIDAEMRNTLNAIVLDDVYSYLNNCHEERLGSLQMLLQEQEDDALKKELKETRAASMPQITAGYMSELTREEKFRGVSFGVSLPLWSNRKNVARMKAQAELAKAEQEEAMAQLTAKSNSLVAKMDMTTKMLENIQSSLSALSTETMMRTALEEGQISVFEYLLDRSDYYDLRSQMTDLRRQYMSALVEYTLIGTLPAQ